jgi:hypothetical protein
MPNSTQINKCVKGECPHFLHPCKPYIAKKIWDQAKTEVCWELRRDTPCKSRRSLGHHNRCAGSCGSPVYTREKPAFGTYLQLGTRNTLPSLRMCVRGETTSSPIYHPSSLHYLTLFPLLTLDKPYAATKHATHNAARDPAVFSLNPVTCPLRRELIRLAALSADHRHRLPPNYTHHQRPPQPTQHVCSPSSVASLSPPDTHHIRTYISSWRKLCLSFRHSLRPCRSRQTTITRTLSTPTCGT